MKRHGLTMVLLGLHLWRGQLPAWLPRGTHVVYVRTTDMFGQTFIDKRLFRVE